MKEWDAISIPLSTVGEALVAVCGQKSPIGALSGKPDFLEEVREMFFQPRVVVSGLHGGDFGGAVQVILPSFSVILIGG